MGIKTENNLGIEDLIKNEFIKGNCKNVSNITTIGNDTISIGQFSNGENVIDLKNGIILSTGDIALAQGPNTSNDITHAFDEPSNDPDLSLLATGDLFDATGIEFDFVPLGNTVIFRYVFASDEYCEFVNSDFNDVFGFFVSGPGINGTFDNNAINVATVQPSNEDVSINTINHLKNVDSYVHNSNNIDFESCGIGFTPRFEDFIEYDGFTVPLTAFFRVIPCETYHIRLVIGDVGDPNLDSAVFLETNSFDLGESINIRAEVPGRSEPIAYESCVDGQFVFTRSSSSNINEDFTIEYSINPESTATNGVDFLEIPMSVTIPAGDTSFILPITIIEDNIIEGPENLKLVIAYDCDCIDPSRSELIINEANEFSISIEEIVVCIDQPFSIVPEVIGGIPPFDFLWNTGAQTDTLVTSITIPSDFTVTITDFCGNISLGMASIGIQTIPTASLMGTYNFCEIVDTGIPVQLEGNPPWEIGYSIDGVEQTPIENIQTNPFFLNTPSEGIYEITVFKDAFCEGSITGTAIVETTFDVEVDIVPPACFNSADGRIELTNLDAIPPFTFQWNINTTDDFLLENLPADTYTLSIVDGDGCVYEKAFKLTAASNDINDCRPVYIPNSFSPNEDGINDVFSIYFDPTSGIENIKSMEVYSRWGELIYKRTNFIPDNGDIGWNGNFKGNPLNPGVYVYKILIRFEDGRTLQFSGDVTLIR